jgi:MFS family permease
MLAATALLAMALLGCVVAEHLVVLAGCVVLIGCSWSVWLLARLTYVTDATDVELRGRALATLGGANRIGVFLGPFCGAAAVRVAGLDGAFAVHVAASVVGLVVLALAADPVAVRSVPDSEPVTTSGGVPGGASGGVPGVAPNAGPSAGHGPMGVRRAMAVGRPGAWAAAGVTVTVGLLRASRQALLPLSAQAAGLDEATVALLFGLSAAIDMTFFYPVGHLSDRFGRRSVAVPCIGLLALGHVVMASGTGSALVAAAILLGVGNGFGSGIVMTLSADFSPVRGRAAFLGSFRLLGDIGTSAGP